jgi:hypothetical protein
MDNISRFTDDKSQVPKYGTLQAPIKEEEGSYSGGGAEENPVTTPVQPKKKRNEPSSASPAKTRSVRWEKYTNEVLLNEEQKYLKSLNNPKTSESTKKTQKSNLKNIREEITRRNIR